MTLPRQQSTTMGFRNRGDSQIHFVVASDFVLAVLFSIFGL